MSAEQMRALPVVIAEKRSCRRAGSDGEFTARHPSLHSPAHVFGGCFTAQHATCMLHGVAFHSLADVNCVPMHACLVIRPLTSSLVKSKVLPVSTHLSTAILIRSAVHDVYRLLCCMQGLLMAARLAVRRVALWAPRVAAPSRLVLSAWKTTGMALSQLACGLALPASFAPVPCIHSAAYTYTPAHCWVSTCHGFTITICASCVQSKRNHSIMHKC